MFANCNFQSRYILEGSEKLNYLTSRQGDKMDDESAHMKGKCGGFAPHADHPDQVKHKLRSDLPVWGMCLVFGLVCVLGFLGLRTARSQHTESRMTAYSDVVKLAPRTANQTITSP